jgi:hypothetical protein
MVWDLRAALLKKQEVETARLVDFEFRLRARTLRLTAEALGLDPAEWAPRVAEMDDDGLIVALAGRSGMAEGDIRARHAACRAEARAQLVRELGDPSPHRLA